MPGVPSGRMDVLPPGSQAVSLNRGIVLFNEVGKQIAPIQTTGILEHRD